MMKLYRNLTMFLAGVGMTVAATSALAGPLPVECLSGQPKQAYDLGYQLWQAELEESWDEVDRECHAAQGFLDANELQPATSGDFNTKVSYCRYQGMLDASGDFGGDVTAQCISACRKDGKFLGRSLAQTVCSSHQVRGHVAYVDFCSEAERTGCKSALHAVVQSQCPEKEGSLKYNRTQDICESLSLQ